MLGSPDPFIFKESAMPDYLIIGIGVKSYGFQKILHFENQPCNRLYPKNQLECIGKAVMMLYIG